MLPTVKGHLTSYHNSQYSNRSNVVKIKQQITKKDKGRDFVTTNGYSHSSRSHSSLHDKEPVLPVMVNWYQCPQTFLRQLNLPEVFLSSKGGVWLERRISLKVMHKWGWAPPFPGECNDWMDKWLWNLFWWAYSGSWLKFSPLYNLNIIIFLCNIKSEAKWRC